LEDSERVRALQAAVEGSASGTELWAEAILAYTWYYIDVSRYAEALRMVKTLEVGLRGSPLEQKYRCGALTMAGIALFTSFRSLRIAEQNLREACDYQNVLGDDLEVRRWIASAYHYRGRIAEVEKRYKTALSLYLTGQSVQLQGPEELQALAFTHVRISEPLINAGLFQAARDHLNIALEQFQLAADRSSGRLQVQLGFATLSAAQGHFDDALDTVEVSRVEASAVGYWRGELLCLGYLLAIYVRRRRFLRVARVLIQMLRTIRYGELRRNNAVMLLARVPVMLRVALRRTSHKTDSGTAKDEALARCSCPMHLVEG
jgi:hypothetical protein